MERQQAVGTPKARVASAAFLAAFIEEAKASGLVARLIERHFMIVEGLVRLALLGTLVGAFRVILGVSPRTQPDVIYHIGLVAVLICGVVVAVRAGA